MDKVIRYKDMPIRRAFITCVLSALVLILAASGLTIWGCSAFRSWLLPESDSVLLSVLTEYENGTTVESEMALEMGQELSSILSPSGETTVIVGQNVVSYTVDKIEKDYHTLSPKRQLAYLAAGSAMVILPMIYSIVGILLCGIWFYRTKLKRPLEALSDATSHITERDLDFSVAYESGDEMGTLCQSFEAMRKALLEANQELWNTLEERQKLHASVAHDLRNPIAIIKGYIEYLQINMQGDGLAKEEILQIADHLAFASDRLERYAESVRHINQIEAMTIQRTLCRPSDFLAAIERDMEILIAAETKDIELTTSVSPLSCPDKDIFIDKEAYSRVLENLVQNALRFASKAIHLHWQISNGYLSTTVTDDGPGFSVENLHSQNAIRFADSPEGGKPDNHLGIGLEICGILCRKHGGKLIRRNLEAGGAEVEFTFNIQ